VEGLNTPGKAAPGNMLRALGPSLILHLSQFLKWSNFLIEPVPEFYQAKLLFHVATSTENN
jgi:hypothetical protein